MPLPRGLLRMTDAEIEDILARAHTMRIGTVSQDGWPHVVPLWFVWHDGEIWVNNLRKSKRSRDLASGSPAAVCVDEGVQYSELRGVVLYGRFTEATDDPRLPDVRLGFAAKYWGGHEVPDIKSHIWLRMKPDKVVSWDFHKIPAGGDKRLEDARKHGH